MTPSMPPMAAAGPMPRLERTLLGDTEPYPICARGPGYGGGLPPLRHAAPAPPQGQALLGPFTQRSNHFVKKDHNRFDYKLDYLDPVREFLKRKWDWLSRGRGWCWTPVRCCSTASSPRSTAPDTPQHLSEKAAEEAEHNNRLRNQRKPHVRQSGPMGVVELIVGVQHRHVLPLLLDVPARLLHRVQPVAV